MNINGDRKPAVLPLVIMGKNTHFKEIQNGFINFILKRFLNGVDSHFRIVMGFLFLSYMIAGRRK
jgi:hypothetical protein